jgi:hypothetical protein
MADSKISDLTAVVTPAGTDELAVNQGGVSKKITATQLVSLATGGVQISGTPVDNQLGVWTSADTQEGDAGLTWSGTVLDVDGTIQTNDGGGSAMLDAAGSTVAPNLLPNKSDTNTGFSGAFADNVSIVCGGVEALRIGESGGLASVSPKGPIGAIDGTVSLPSISFVNDLDSGLYLVGADVVGVTVGGVQAMTLTEAASAITVEVPGTIQTSNAAGPQLVDVAAALTTPTIVPDRADTDTGIGTNGPGVVTIIGDGVDVLQIKNSGGAQQLAAEDGSLGAPAYSFIADNNLGFYRSGTGVISMVDATTIQWSFQAAAFGAGTATGPAFRNRAPTGILPNVLPNKADADTGVGQNAADSVSLVAGGLELLRANETGASTSDQVIIGPAGVIGAAATPSLAWGDGDTGIYETGDDSLAMTLAGAQAWFWSGVSFGGSQATGPALVNEVVSATNPTVIPGRNDPDTGVGTAGDDAVTLIAGGNEAVTYAETLGRVLQTNEASVGLTASTTQSQGQQTLFGSYNEVSVCANDNDVVTLPAAAEGTRCIIKNNGANILQIFPESGDDLGEGLNTSTTLAAGESVEYFGLSASVWTEIANSTPTVGKAGTPANNKVAVFTDANTIEGTGNFEFNDSQVLGPDGTAALPAYSFVSDPNTGIYTNIGGGDTLGFSMAGSLRFWMGSGVFKCNNSGGGGIVDLNSSRTVPSVLPNAGDPNVGLGYDGGAGADRMNIVVGGKAATEWVELSTGVLINEDADVGLTAAAGSSQGDGPIASSYNVYSTVATTGDAATLPATFNVHSIVYIKNDGANSMDVFPASGDDAGAGTDTAVAVAAGDFAVFFATAANATWTKLMGGTA